MVSLYIYSKIYIKPKLADFHLCYDNWFWISKIKHNIEVVLMLLKHFLGSEIASKVLDIFTQNQI